jgi:ParB-like chromosome segregation protein Spo0J
LNAIAKAVSVELPPYTLTPVRDLIPYAENSRLHSDRQIDLLASSIKEFGFTNPVLIDGERGIIAGHGRVLAAKKLGLREVPTLELAYLSPAQRRAYVIADNRLAEVGSSWDTDQLAQQLGILQEEGFDLDVVGYDQDALDRLLGEGALPPLQDGVTDQGSGEEDPDLADTKLVLGPYRIEIGREDFLAWQEEMRAKVGFEKDSIQAEILRRLDLRGPGN